MGIGPNSAFSVVKNLCGNRTQQQSLQFAKASGTHHNQVSWMLAGPIRDHPSRISFAQNLFNPICGKIELEIV